MRRFEQWQDMIGRLFPEYMANGSTDRNDRVLSQVVTFQVTDACDLSCLYCYQIHKGNRSMSFETAKKYIDLIISGEKGFSDYINPTKSPGIILEFIGGEPFLEIDLIDKICDYFSNKVIELQHPWATKYIFSICSNGVSYFDERVQKFLRKWNGHISFSVTIDGNKELHDSCRRFPDGRPSYDLAVAAAKDWMSRGYQMGSKITIAPENVTFFYDAIKHMIELGYTEINANCVYEKGWEPRHATILYSEMKKIADYFLENDLDFDREYYCSIFEPNFFHPKPSHDLQNWCGGNGVMLSCDPDGYLFPCIRYMESSLGNDQEAYSIGHVDIGICQTECDKCRVDCLKKIDRRTQSTDECFYCPIAEGCSWCFKAGTLITTPDGFKEIQDIKVGDKVISGSGKIQMVEQVSSHFANNTVCIKAMNGAIWYTTIEHPFLIRRINPDDSNTYGNSEWVKAADIKRFDRVGFFGYKNDKWACSSEHCEYDEENNIMWVNVGEVNANIEGYEVFNMSVSDEHTYLANGAIVHNCTAYNYQVFGTPDARATYICIMHKARALGNYYFWNKYYRKHNRKDRMAICIPDKWALEIINEDELNMLKELSEED